MQATSSSPTSTVRSSHTTTSTATSTTSTPSGNPPQLHTRPAPSGIHAAQQQLFAAATQGDAKVVRKLLADGQINVAAADPVKGKTALMHAVRHGQQAIARQLLEAGADVNQARTDGWTPLMLAAWRSQTAMARLLLKAGAKADHVSASGETALLLAAGTEVNDCNDGITSALLRAGAPVNHTNRKGCTALLRAASSGQRATLEALLAFGARVDFAQYDGKTALMLAAGEGHLAAFETLLDGGPTRCCATRKARPRPTMPGAPAILRWQRLPGPASVSTRLIPEVKPR